MNIFWCRIKCHSDACRDAAQLHIGLHTHYGAELPLQYEGTNDWMITYKHEQMITCTHDQMFAWSKDQMIPCAHAQMITKHMIR